MLGLDVRHAFRLWRRAPVVTAGAILTLAIGVGANTAVFSVVHGVILRPLPYPGSDRLVELSETNLPRNLFSFSVSALNYLSWSGRSRSFEALAAFQSINLTLTGAGDAERLPASAVTSSMFRVLHLAPIVGREMRAEDEQPGAERVALLAEPLWRARFGADPAMVGRSITLSGEPHRVIGVVPPEFAVSRSQGAQVFVPLVIEPERERRGNHTLRVVGRLRPGASLGGAREEMRAIASAMEQDFPESNRDWGIRLETLYDTMFDERLRRSLLVLLGAVAVVLAMACANVANLLLAKAATRRRELALRAALGAGRGRLVRQLLTESVCLASVSGACGLAVSYLGVEWLRPLLPPTLPRIDEIRVDAVVLTYGLLVSVVGGLLVGIATAVRATRGDLLPGLTQSGRGFAGSPAAPLLHGLVVAQMALGTMLLVGAALLLQSFLRMQLVPLGFDPAGVMTARISLPQGSYRDPGRTSDFYDRLRQAPERRPQVRAAGLATSAPFTSGVRAMASVRDPSSSDAGVTAVEHLVTPGYFQAAGIPILMGRSFLEYDSTSSPPVVVVSQGVGRQLWGDQNPIGRTVSKDERQYEVVGMVGDVRGSDGQGLTGGGPERPPRAAVYFSATQWPQRTMTLLVRVAGDPSGVAPGIREAVRTIDPAQPIYQLRTLRDWLTESSAQPRLTSSLTGVVALVALLLAAVGVYGVLSYSVAQRKQEIGVRLALGAARGQVIRLVLFGGLSWAVVGVAIGLVSAFAFSRVLAAVLFEVSARDPATFAAAGTSLAVVALVASYIPAARATRIDPTIALRSE